MYIVSSFRGSATVKSNIFFVIVFESQKPPHLNGRWGGERKEGVWKVDGRVWNGCRRCAADRSRQISIPAMGGNRTLTKTAAKSHGINPRNGGAIDNCKL